MTIEERFKSLGDETYTKIINGNRIAFCINTCITCGDRVLDFRHEMDDHNKWHNDRGEK
jgi:hypothetical protein